jgi:hypothetical protein
MKPTLVSGMQFRGVVVHYATVLGHGVQYKRLLQRAAVCLLDALCLAVVKWAS